MLVPPAALIAVGVLMALGGWVVQATDRAEPVQFGIREIAVIAREGTIKALIWALSPLAWFARTSPPAERAFGARHPVLLVPGLSGGRMSLHFLRIFLERRGWPVVWAMPLPGGDPNLPELAAEVGRAVESFTQSTGATRIDIVAHGTGGLAAAWYAQHMDRGARVRRLVTVGTPWRGTRLAVFIRGRLGPELLWGSPLLASLQPPIVPTVALGGLDDPTVVPASSCFPMGATAVRIEGAGHLELLASPRAFRAVAEALTQPLSATRAPESAA